MFDKFNIITTLILYKWILLAYVHLEKDKCSYFCFQISTECIKGAYWTVSTILSLHVILWVFSCFVLYSNLIEKWGFSIMFFALYSKNVPPFYLKSKFLFCLRVIKGKKKQLKFHLIFFFVDVSKMKIKWL